MSARQAIRWVEVAFAAQRRAIVTALYEVNIRKDTPAYALTIDHRWVFDGDGRLSVFETPEVARRFLELLGISTVGWEVKRNPPELPDQTNFRRFIVSRRKLMEDPIFRQPYGLGVSITPTESRC